MNSPSRFLLSVYFATLLAACGSDSQSIEERLSDELEQSVVAAANGAGLAAFTLPDETDLANIPTDPLNPLTAEKVALGQMLYHETGLSTAGTDVARTGTYSCASCHHFAAGFKAGVPQGVADGGEAFGLVGEARILGAGMDPGAADGDPLKPDLQPLASPTTLNVAFQEVMLWNGQFGNSSASAINAGIAPAVLATPGTPKVANTRGLSGVETQAVAGLGVHRLNVEVDSLLQSHPDYQALFQSAFPASTDTLEDAAKAIAAYERTLLTTQAPFQRWLAGDRSALTASELRGGILFFGEAGCIGCHTGPALSSAPGASANEVFHAVGFADFDINDPRIHGNVDSATARGRGGFTGVADDNFKFKIPPLYNLTDAGFYGHGASFNSVRDVVAYKNAAVAQKASSIAQLSPAFTPLGLSESEIDDLTTFIELGLHDPDLARYVPQSLPSGNCFPNADSQSLTDLGC